MRISEIGRLVWLNLVQNKSKVVLTSTGIIVGAATIMLVIAIGTGGKLEVAEQFKNLNAGAIDVSYEGEAQEGQMFGMLQMPGENRGGGNRGGGQAPGGMGMPGGMFGMGEAGEQEEKITLTEEDMEDLQTFVPGIADATMTFSLSASVEGGELESSTNRTVAGVKSNYMTLSNLTMAAGSFFTEENESGKEKVCVLGWDTAKEIFGSAYEALEETVYIDGRPYTVSGVAEEMGTVSAGISPDSAIFIPYATGIKYLTGSDVSPTVTVIAEEVSEVETVMENIEAVLAESYPNASFTISDAGSKMEAASKSNETLTVLLAAMAAIVFLVGGIGIMNVLFVSVKERTNEIGILKAIGCSRRDILLEFLLEASCISLIGAVIGVLSALALTPLIETFSVRVELSVQGAVLALAFGILTGTVFGFYPAYKASCMIPVAALNHE